MIRCPACGAVFGMPAGEWNDDELALLDEHLDGHLVADDVQEEVAPMAA